MIEARRQFDASSAAKPQIDFYIRYIWLICCFNAGLFYLWHILNSELIGQIQNGMIPTNPLAGGNIEQSYQTLFNLFYSPGEVLEISPSQIVFTFSLLVVINLLFWISVALLIKWGIKSLVYYHVLFRQHGLKFLTTFKGVQILLLLPEEQPIIYFFNISNVLLFPFIVKIISA